MLNPEKPLKEVDTDATLSLRAVTALEVASVIISVLITVWVVVPLQLSNRGLVALPALLALTLIINSQRLRGETPRELGFTTRHFGKALKLLLVPMFIGSVALIAFGYLTHSFQIKPRFWTSVTILPLWGLMQQYILQAFIYRRVKFILIDEHLSKPQWLNRTRLAVFLTATVFALIHAPNLALMSLALVGGLVWSWVYERAPNLFALTLAHAFMSVLIILALPADSMRIGYDYFLYHKF